MVLDQFSSIQVSQWRVIATEADAYYIKVFYELEAQRRAFISAIVGALQLARPLELRFDDWVRIVDYRYSLDPLSAKGSTTGVGGRFNYGANIDPMSFPPFSALYLAQTEATAYREKFGLEQGARVEGLEAHELALRKNNFTVVRVRGAVSNIFDLTDAQNVKPFVKAISSFTIKTKMGRMPWAAKMGTLNPIVDIETFYRSVYHSAWEGWPRQHSIPANGQEFGRLVLEAGFEGIRYDSTKGDGQCLVLFPRQLTGSSSYVELAGDVPPECVQRRLDASTWKTLV